MTEKHATVPNAPITNNQVVANPLLDRARLPGETFRLPSCGIFYTNGELSEDVDDGEVHIHPMTAIDEIVISSPSKLFSGEGVLEVISRCVPSILKPSELLAQDVDFILLCLRKVSYGPKFEFDRVHVDCSAKEEDGPSQSHPYQIDVNAVIRQTKELDPSKISSTYRIELDNGQIINMQPMRFKSYVSIMQLVSQKPDESSLTDEEQKNMILNQLAGMINSVDEISDAAMIREWLEVISPAEVRKINKSVAKMGSWGVNTSYTIKCRDCKEEMEVEMPTNPLALFS